MDLCPAPFEGSVSFLGVCSGAWPALGAHPHDELIRVERGQLAAAALFAAIEADQPIPKAEFQTREPLPADRAARSGRNQRNPRGFQGKISVSAKSSAAIQRMLHRSITMIEFA